MKLFLTTALAISLSVPAISAELPPRLPLGSPVVRLYQAPVEVAPRVTLKFEFETIGYNPTVPSADYNALREAFNSEATTEEERSYMTGVVSRHSLKGVTDWPAVRSEYFAARAVAVETHRPIGDPLPDRHHPSKFWNGVGQVVAGVLTVAAGAYVGVAENTYHTSDSYTDSHGRTITVRCSTYVNGTTVDSSCR